MKKLLLLLLPLSPVFCGCTAVQSAADSMPDPNTLLPVGEDIVAVGTEIGRPEVAGIGMVIVGLAAILKALRSK